MPIQRLKYLFRRVTTYSHILNIYSTILNTYSPSRILTNVGGCAAGVRGSHPGRPLFVLARRAHLRALTQAPSRRAVSPVEGLSGAGHSSTHGRGSRARRGLGGASGRVLRVRGGECGRVGGFRSPHPSRRGVRHYSSACVDNACGRAYRARARLVMLRTYFPFYSPLSPL